MQILEGGVVRSILTGALGDLGVTGTRRTRRVDGVLVEGAARVGPAIASIAAMTRATVANKMMRFISATSFIGARLVSPAALRN
jgi:hypothetical protein